MDILWMIVIGLVVGVLAKLLMPGRDRLGIIVTILLGIGGSFLAGYIGRAFGWYQGSVEGPGMFASILGAMLLLLLYRLVIGRRRIA
jgi:uncharacterized membrane protein YeaQ/YmgE (transglycosylase-associated protein family)